MHSYIIKSPLY